MRQHKVVGNNKCHTVLNIFDLRGKACIGALSVKRYRIDLALPLRGERDVFGVEITRNLIFTVNVGESGIAHRFTVGVGNCPADELPACANGIANGNSFIVLIAGEFSAGQKVGAVAYGNTFTQIVGDVNIDRIPLGDQADFVITVFVCFGCVNCIAVFKGVRIVFVVNVFVT